MANEGMGFIESALRAFGAMLGAAEADAATDGLVAVAVLGALALVIGSWFLRPGALDRIDFSFDSVDHCSSVGDDGTSCGQGDGGTGD